MEDYNKHCLESVNTPYNTKTKKVLLDKFNQDGWVLLDSTLSNSNVEALKSALDDKLNDSQICQCDDCDNFRTVSSMRMFEYSRAYRDLLEIEPIIGLVEEILGDDCHVLSQNALRSEKNEGIVNWHIDDHLYHPFLQSLQLEPGSVDIPCNALNVMIPLTDIVSEEDGPTQIVEASHFSGVCPVAGKLQPSEIVFRGNRPKSIFAKEGSIYLINSQTWHRGMQIRSDRVRYMSITTYGRRCISQRFFPFLNYQMPAHVMVQPGSKTLRLLGKHEKGPYG